MKGQRKAEIIKPRSSPNYDEVKVTRYQKTRFVKVILQ